MIHVQGTLKTVLALAAFGGLAACVDNVETGTATEEVLTTFSGFDPGADHTEPRPNSNAARANFLASLGGAGMTTIDFESSPVGTFVNLAPAPGVSINLSSTTGNGLSGIQTGNGNPLIEGYNTTGGGSRYLRIFPDFGNGSITVTFTYAEPIRGFGAYFTGVATAPGTSVRLLFDDGSAQNFALPGGAGGGAGFFGFTDPGKGITEVQVRETLLASARDIYSIDDVITARDNRAPTAVCTDVTIDADTTCSGTASVDGGSSDPDGDVFTCVQSPASPYGLGATTVTLTCTDTYGQSSSCDATVTVNDTTDPDLHCPADQTLECVGGGATAAFVAEAHDSCDADPTVSCDPPSGSTFPLGSTDGTCTATDDSGNSSECTHTVDVVDTTPPVVTGGNNAGSLWPPNHAYQRVDLAQCITQVQDACHGALTVANARVTCCSSDEPDNANGDGSTGSDCVIVDHDSVDVRAERQGGGNGRVYTIRYDVTDPSGNVTSSSCKVGVPHDRKRPAVDDGALSCGVTN